MAHQTRLVEITPKDLPLHCPTDQVALWCSHPRIFLDIATTGEAQCPYCGTLYRLKSGETVTPH
ncbi:MAG: zinc-finger domain-containing protein [Methylophilaceae bacterium]|nr:zinc-finger domain-containing protein [Methylophilaceae bacterium]